MNAWAILNEVSDIKKFIEKNGYDISEVYSNDILVEDDIYEKLANELEVGELELRLLGIKLSFNNRYKLYRLKLRRQPLLKKLFSQFIFKDVEGSIILTN